jgi:hypothetical protein
MKLHINILDVYSRLPANLQWHVGAVAKRLDSEKGAYGR